MDNNILYKKRRIVRVICRYKVGDSFGTGFFIEKNGKLLTCFHVLFGQELKNIRNNTEFVSIIGADEHTRLEEFYKNKIASLTLELASGKTIDAELVSFDERFDIAILKTKDGGRVDFFEIDVDDEPDYDDNIFFCGYQLASGYAADKYPFSVNAGQVSSFPEVIVGGEKYTHIQVNSINLGGNSGAPFFREGSNKVIGVVNGNMNWGSDNLAFIDDSSGSTKFIKGTLRPPLSIAFVTSFKKIKESTDIFKNLSK